MTRSRLSDDQITEFLDTCPSGKRDVILALREFVFHHAPEAEEAIKFNSLCYFKPNCPYGSIGGNICGIGSRGDAVLLSFIHGASLPDPHHLLTGDGKAMRKIEIRTADDFTSEVVADLIRAAVRYDPANE